MVVIGGDKPGLGLAGVARGRGAAVAVLEESAVFASANGRVGRWRYVHEAREQGIALHAGARVTAIDGTRVFWTDAAGAERESEADLVLVTTGVTPDPSLVQELSRLGVQADAIGDCRQFDRVEGAMRDATRAALAL